MEPTLRTAQVLKQEAEDIGLQGKDIAEYVTRQQTLDREERAAWREAQKRQVEIRMAELQAEDKKRADELQAEREKRADEIRFAQIDAVKEQTKIEAEKELALKELELKAQQNQAVPALQLLQPLVIKMLSPRSYHPLLIRRMNLTATCYVLNAMLKMLVGRRTHGLLS